MCGHRVGFRTIEAVLESVGPAGAPGVVSGYGTKRTEARVEVTMNDHLDGDVLVSDPRVTVVPLNDCEEELADCRSLMRVDSRRSDPHGDWAHLRVGLAVCLSNSERAA